MSPVSPVPTAATAVWSPLEWPLSTQLLAGVAALIAVTVAWVLYLKAYYRFWHPLRSLPGRNEGHWLLGDLPNVMKRPTGVYLYEAIQDLGHTLRTAQFLGEPSIVTADIGAIAYIQQHADLFIKPPTQTRVLTQLLGRGVLNAEHADHRRQRRVLNPAFSPAAIREMMPIFYQKGYEMRDRIMDRLEDPDVTYRDEKAPLSPLDRVPGSRKIDIAKFLNEVTFDVIGLAGFDYDFNCLVKPNIIIETFRGALSALMNMSPVGLFQVMFPAADVIPTTRNRLVRQSLENSQIIGAELVAKKKAELKALQGGGSIEKDTNVGKDLLSLIVKANMAADLPANQRLSDQEIIYQVSTFLLAGSETSSNGVGWCLYRLSNNPEIQERLREELFTISEEEPSLEQLNALPFLESCLRESLRLDPPVPETVRMATADAVLPLSSPIKGADGRMIDAIPMKKGNIVFESFINVHHDKTIWGEDAFEFNPDRFSRPGIPAKAVPGSWGNLASFNGGARNCIGYRFALAEMKALLFILLRNFKFDALPSKPTMTQKNFIVMLPWVVGEESYGSQLPLLVTPYAGR